MVVVVAYFGSRTNLIILPQASQSNFSTCPPLLSSPARRLLSTTCCISQHTETEKCSAMRGISFINKSGAAAGWRVRIAKVQLSL